VNFLESDKENMENEEMEKMPKAERTSEGKWKCQRDRMEYDTKEDYEAHCKEEHME
jgi:hypothetical protein